MAQCNNYYKVIFPNLNMRHMYTIKTSYPRDFDSETKEKTFGMIINYACDNLIDWALPKNTKNTVIKVETSKPIDIGDLVSHLDDEFGDWDGGKEIVTGTFYDEI